MGCPKQPVKYILKNLYKSLDNLVDRCYNKHIKKGKAILNTRKARNMKNKTYYFPNPEYESDFFGNGDTICVDFAEVERIANEWGYENVDDLLSELHEASEFEIAEYGTYDS